MRFVLALLSLGLLWSQETGALPEWRLRLDRAIALDKERSPGVEKTFLEAAQSARSAADGGLAHAVVSAHFSVTLLRLERYRETEQLLLPTLPVFDRHPGRAPVEHLLSMNNLASVYQQTGQAQRELQYRLLALKVAELVRPPDATLVVPLLGNLAVYYAQNGRIADVAALVEKAKVYEADASVANHPVWTPLLIAHSEHYLQRGEFKAARDRAAQALKIAEQAGYASAIEVVGPLHQLARAEMELARWSVAERHWKRSLETVRAHHSRDFPQVASFLIPLATLARLQGRMEECEELLREASRIADLSRQPYMQAVVKRELANLYAARKRHTQAEPLFRSSLALTAGSIGKGNAEYAICLFDFAGTLTALRKYAEAEMLLREAIQRTEQLRTSFEPALLLLLERHAQVLRKLKRNEEAKQVQARAQALRSSGVTDTYGHTVDVLGLRPKR